MTPLESVMWRAGAAPDLRPEFVSMTILARPPGRARLRRLLSQAATVLPTLRRTVRATGCPPGGHEWIDDAAFDIDRHLRRVAAPRPGRQEDLLGLVAGLGADPLPGHGPSWEVVVVAGLDGGGAAVVQRLHHSIADGVDAVRLWRRLLSAGESPRGSADPRVRSAPPVAADGAGAPAPDGLAAPTLAPSEGGRAPVAPLDTVVGAARRLDLGVNIDPAAVTEPGVLMSCLRRSFAAFA
jgi:hypothetical protein